MWQALPLLFLQLALHTSRSSVHAVSTLIQGPGGPCPAPLVTSVIVQPAYYSAVFTSASQIINIFGGNQTININSPTTYIQNTYITTTVVSTVTTTAQIGAPTPTPGETFVISIQSQQAKQRKRALNFVRFLDGSNNATLTSDNALAARFYFDTDGHLLVGSEYINADTSSGYIAFMKSKTKPINQGKWSITTDGTLVFTASKNGFCVADSSVYILLTQTPMFACAPVSLRPAGMFETDPRDDTMTDLNQTLELR